MNTTNNIFKYNSIINQTRLISPFFVGVNSQIIDNFLSLRSSLKIDSMWKMKVGRGFQIQIEKVDSRLGMWGASGID